MKINSVHLVTMCKMESKKKKRNCFLLLLFFSPSPFQTISTEKVQLLLLFILLSSFFQSIYLSIISICSSTHPSIFKALFVYQKPATLLSTFNRCGLSANLNIHWLKTQAIVYEFLYLDVFEGADKRVWQLLKDFKNDKELQQLRVGR